MKFGAGKGSASHTGGKDAPSLPRKSSGLDQFCSILQSYENLSVLDLSGISQANIGFITGLGHRISSDDILGTMTECFGRDFLAGQQAASNAQRFLDKSFIFPEASFDAVLVWDTFQFLTSPLIEQAVNQLFRVLRPGAHLLLFFNAQEKAPSIPVYNYRIQNRKTLLQMPRSGTAEQQGQYFNSRRVEKLFERASSIKFFLTRDHLRDVIVRR